MTGREFWTLVVAVLVALALVTFLAAWLITRTARRRPRGRHALAPLPVAGGWGDDEDGERVSVWLAGVRRSLSVHWQAAELRVRVLVAGQLVTDAERSLTSAARQARRAWEPPRRHRHRDPVQEAWSAAIAEDARRQAAATRAERDAREAATGRPWRDQTGSFAAIRTGGQS